jgi:hypothetical protein
MADICEISDKSLIYLKRGKYLEWRQKILPKYHNKLIIVNVLIT